MEFDLQDEGVFDAGSIPIDVFGDWPGVVTTNVVVTWERRVHIVTNHADVLTRFRDLLVTLNDPDEAHRYHEQNVIELFGWYGREHAWTAKVRVAMEEGRSNSALTFYRMRRDRVVRRRHRADSVWTRG